MILSRHSKTKWARSFTRIKKLPTIQPSWNIHCRWNPAGPMLSFLAKGSVIVMELKGKLKPSQADIDQAAAYVRDLRCYHQECAERPVLALCVPMKARGYLSQRHNVHILGPDAVDGFIDSLPSDPSKPPIVPAAFLAESAYRPLPTLVQAARELFNKGDLRPIHRARAATDPAVFKIKDIIHEAAAERSRRLILLTGVPGAGKTLVGLRTVHAHYLDDLAVPRANGMPTAPAVFLSGNGPLVNRAPVRAPRCWWRRQNVRPSSEGLRRKIFLQA